MNADWLELHGGPHDGTRINPTVRAAWREPNTIPVRDLKPRADQTGVTGIEVYGAFDGPHLYTVDSDGRWVHVPQSVTFSQ